MSKPEVVTVQLENSNGTPCGKRRFAVEARRPVLDAEWNDNPQIPCQSDQWWEIEVWKRIEDRGYVVRLQGGGQWSNRGDKGTYVGTGATAESALTDAWGHGNYDGEVYGWDGIPSDLVAACRQYDQTVTEPDVE